MERISFVDWKLKFAFKDFIGRIFGHFDVVLTGTHTGQHRICISISAIRVRRFQIDRNERIKRAETTDGQSSTSSEPFEELGSLHSFHFHQKSDKIFVTLTRLSETMICPDYTHQLRPVLPVRIRKINSAN